MRNRRVTSVSKRAAEDMMRDAVRTAAWPAGSMKSLDAARYLDQLMAAYLTQDQMTAIECLIDIAFEGGQADERLRRDEPI